MGYHDEDEDLTVKSQVKQWQQSGDDFLQCGKNYPGLPPGAYTLDFNWQKGVIAKPFKLKTESLIVFPNSPVEKMTKEVDSFWQSREVYENLGLAWRRGFLLTGPPGNGKSGIVQLVGRGVIKQGGVVIMVDDPEVLNSCANFLFDAEKQTNLVMVLEDIDTLIMNDRTSCLLEIIDGASDSKPGMIWLATTNHLEKLPERIARRPSRFDTILEVEKPVPEVRRQYIDSFHTLSSEVRDEIFRYSTELSLAQVKEIVIAVGVYRQKPNETQARLLNREVKKEAPVVEEPLPDDAFAAS